MPWPWEVRSDRVLTRLEKVVTDLDTVSAELLAAVEQLRAEREQGGDGAGGAAEQGDRRPAGGDPRGR